MAHTTIIEEDGANTRTKLALGLGHLGNCLGPPRERPPNFGAKIEIYIFFFNFFFEI